MGQPELQETPSTCLNTSRDFAAFCLLSVELSTHGVRQPGLQATPSTCSAATDPGCSSVLLSGGNLRAMLAFAGLTLHKPVAFCQWSSYCMHLAETLILNRRLHDQRNEPWTHIVCKTVESIPTLAHTPSLTSSSTSI